MKILFLNYEYPPLGGGAGICTKYEAEGLAKLGHKVTVVTTWYEGEKEESSSINNNLKIIRLKSRRKHTFKSNPIEMLSYSRKAKEFLSVYLINNKFDICIANFTLPGGNVALHLKKKFNIPYVIVSHGGDVPWFFPKQMMKYHLLTYFWIKKICNGSERLILLTKDMKNNADKFLKKRQEKNIIIPNGCDTRNFKPDYSKKSKIFKIIFVGRLSIEKDVFTFLESIRLFKEKNPDIKFILDILGDGPFRREMEDYVKKNNLTENIIFKGWVSKKEMLKEYQSASVQVMTSEAEAMSITILESLSTGQYIISTPVSGNTDMIKEGINGEFIPFKDPKALSEKIKKVHDEKFMKKYIVDKRLLDDFRKKYDWSNIIKEYDKMLREILNKGK